MKAYESLFKLYRDQPLDGVFAHFYPFKSSPTAEPDYDEPFRAIARATVDGYDAWEFQQPRFQRRYTTAVPKLRNYLNYTFMRLLVLEQDAPGKHFLFSPDGQWVCFNTGLQNSHAVDLIMVFQQYFSKNGDTLTRPDWVYKGCFASNEGYYRNLFRTAIPEIAWYSLDSRDFVFDTSYSLDKDTFDHLFERAKERSGLADVSDDAVRNYLSGAIERLIPKIRRNYKVAIPIYYVEERRMQLLLPFASASPSGDISCFLVERNDSTKSYDLKTIFDLDQAYFAARLITRPDKEWLNP